MTTPAAYAKQLLVLRSLLIGAKYFNALIALEFALKYHTGIRKDGISPEFSHQVSIALYAMTLPDLINREAVICVICLHDVREDFGIGNEEIVGLFSETSFALMVALAVDRLTKTFRGVKKDPAQLFAEMALDFLASIVKPCDRIHNFQSMPGVFTIPKQILYIEEGETLIMPMAKLARRNFPQQTLAYESMKWMMTSQIQLIRGIHEAHAV